MSESPRRLAQVEALEHTGQFGQGLEQAVEVEADPLIAVTFHNLGEWSVKEGKPEAARRHYEQAREQFDAILGTKHPFVAHSFAGLGDLDVEAGAYEDAIRNYTRARDLMATAYGEHAYLLQPLIGLGCAYARRGRDAEARASYERAVAIAEPSGTSSTYLGQALAGLGELTAADDPGRARELFARAAVVFAEVKAGEVAGHGG